MAKRTTSRKRPREKQSLPPPLPPETRTVGQLVAESVRLYGRRFWPSLALGIGPAVIGTASTYLPRTSAIVLLSAAGALVMGASSAGASAIVSGRRPTGRTMVVATGVGFLVYGGSGQAVRIAAFLASLVVSPILFLGAALLYYDQEARLRLRSRGTPTKRRRDAHIPDAVDADRPGPADASI